jgi:hypothetical protein
MVCEKRCCCSSGDVRHRRYLTKEEQIAYLEKYAEELNKELQAVKEQVEKLQ